MAYTIQDYLRAIRNRYSRSHWRMIKLLYGDPARDYDATVRVPHHRLPNLTVHPKKMNTCSGNINRTRYELVVDSPNSITLVLASKPSIWTRWYYLRKYPKYADYRARFTTTYTNPDPEYIASILPPDRFVYFKLLYTQIVMRLFPIHHPMLKPEQIRYKPSLRYRLSYISDAYQAYTTAYTWQMRLRQYLLQYIPYYYVKDFDYIGRRLASHYGVDWCFTCLRGGYYPISSKIFDDRYLFDNGAGIKYKFERPEAGMELINPRIVSYRLVPDKKSNPLTWASSQPLTYYGLWRLIKSLPK